MSVGLVERHRLLAGAKMPCCRAESIGSSSHKDRLISPRERKTIWKASHLWPYCRVDIALRALRDASPAPCCGSRWRNCIRHGLRASAKACEDAALAVRNLIRSSDTAGSRSRLHAGVEGSVPASIELLLVDTQRVRTSRAEHARCSRERRLYTSHAKQYVSSRFRSSTGSIHVNRLFMI